MLLPAFIVSLAKHSPVQLGEKAFTKGKLIYHKNLLYGN